MQEHYMSAIELLAELHTGVHLKMPIHQVKSLVCYRLAQITFQAKLSFSPYACSVHARGGRVSFLFF